MIVTTFIAEIKDCFDRGRLRPALHPAVRPALSLLKKERRSIRECTYNLETAESKVSLWFRSPEPIASCPRHRFGLIARLHSPATRLCTLDVANNPRGSLNALYQMAPRNQPARIKSHDLTNQIRADAAGGDWLLRASETARRDNGYLRRQSSFTARRLRGSFLHQTQSVFQGGHNLALPGELHATCHLSEPPQHCVCVHEGAYADELRQLAHDVVENIAH